MLGSSLVQPTTPVSNSGNAYQGIPAEQHPLPSLSTYSNTEQDTDQKVNPSDDN